MLTPARLNVDIWRNAIFPRDSFKLKDQDTQAPIDLTGATLKMQVRVAQGATDPALISVVSGVGTDRITVLDAPGGEFIFVIRQATLQALPAAPVVDKPVEFDWDLTIDFGNGPEVYFVGVLRVHTGVTR